MIQHVLMRDRDSRITDSEGLRHRLSMPCAHLLAKISAVFGNYEYASRLLKFLNVSPCLWLCRHLPAQSCLNREDIGDGGSLRILEKRSSCNWAVQQHDVHLYQLGCA